MSLTDRISKIAKPEESEYLLSLESALKKYHIMVKNGVLKPRGNKVSNFLESPSNFNN